MRASQKKTKFRIPRALNTRIKDDIGTLGRTLTSLENTVAELERSHGHPIARRDPGELWDSLAAYLDCDFSKPLHEKRDIRRFAYGGSAPLAWVARPGTRFDRQHTRILGEMLVRKRDEWATLNARLAASERQYREMFEGHPEPMWVLDARSLAFLRVNDAAVLHYGYSRVEFLAQSLHDILPPEEIQPAIIRLQKTEIGPASVTGFSRHVRKDGAVIEVELTDHKLEFGGRLAYSVLARDVTERNRYKRSLRDSEEQLRLLAGQLQQVREEERARLARELHDDLGQSLTAIQMDLSWLATHPGASPEAISARIVSSMDLADRTIGAAKRLASELS